MNAIYQQEILVAIAIHAMCDPMHYCGSVTNSTPQCVYSMKMPNGK